LPCLVALSACTEPTSLRLHATWSGITVDQLAFQLTSDGLAIHPLIIRPEVPAGPLSSGAELLVLVDDSLGGKAAHVMATALSGGLTVGADGVDVTPSLHLETRADVRFDGGSEPTLAISPSTPTVAAGGTLQLGAILTDPSSGAHDVTPTGLWMSSTPTVATVAAGGLLTTHGAGKSEITVAASGFSATTTVTVTPVVPLATLQITPSSPTVTVGGSLQLKAVLTDQTGNRDVTATAVWTSTPGTVATVAPGGLLSAHGAGATQVGATASGVSATTTVTVSPTAAKQLTSVDCTPTDMTFPKNSGSTEQLTITGHYSDGSTAPLTSSASFVTDDAMVASVSSSGLVTTGKKGDARITGSVLGMSGVCNVHVQ